MQQVADSNIEALRIWLRGCDALSRNNPFRIDFIDDDRTEYALQHQPSVMRYKQNVLGQTVPDTNQAQNFSLMLRLPYGQDVAQNMRNAEFCQAVYNWMLEQNARQNVPNIIDGPVVSVVPTLSPYVAQADAESAIYQIQIQINYKRL